MAHGTQGSANAGARALFDILNIFNSPVNEEQAWGICHQCAQYYLAKKANLDDYRVFIERGSRALRIRRDGEVTIDGVNDIVAGPSAKSFPYTDGCLLTNEKTISEQDVVQALGCVVFNALDHGLSENVEKILSCDLESLLEYMTSFSSDDDSQTVDDEGIEHDSEDRDHSYNLRSTCNFRVIIQLCEQHLSNPQDAVHHYKAVCRALVAEHWELVTFLDKVSNEKKKLSEVYGNNEGDEIARLEALQQTDWACLWIQVMCQLRHGVKLKKVENHQVALSPVEYELTPFEMLMEDIRYKRYKLNKIMVNGGIPPKVKSDAHALILEFIRSRPPLHPAKDRILNNRPPRLPDLREKLLDEIRSQPKLRPIKDGKILVETSRTKLNIDDEDESPLPARKVIRPDFNLILDNSFEVDDDDDGQNSSATKTVSWQKAVTRDLATQDRTAKLQRRHTIMVCESPTDSKVFPGESGLHSLTTLSEADELAEDGPAKACTHTDVAAGGGNVGFSELNATDLMHVSWKNACPRSDDHGPSLCQDCRPLSKKWQNPIECLSLTLEEVVHIRTVLTKAEVESLLTQPALYSQVVKGKVCFSCKIVKFSIFGQWGTKCHFCTRLVCSSCIRKMNIPTEHFKKIPVYTLSPSPLSTESIDLLKVLTSSGSVPPTPPSQRREELLSKSPRQRRRPLQRSQTIMEKLTTPSLPSRILKGTPMNICCDCKSMICEIIRASRVSVALANQEKQQSPQSRKASPVASIKSERKLSS